VEVDDAGATWQHIGLEDTVKIDSIVVDPADYNLVIVSALGDTSHHGGGVLPFPPMAARPGPTS